MEIDYYPDKAAVDKAIELDDPIIILVSYDKKVC